MADIPAQLTIETPSKTGPSQAGAPAVRPVASDIPDQNEKNGGVPTITGPANEIHQQPFRDITLEDGQTIRIASNRADEMENPLHVGITSNIPSTPGYFRLLMPALTARYFARAGIDTLFEFDSPKADTATWWNLPHHIANTVDHFSTKDADILTGFIRSATDDGRRNVGELSNEFLKNHNPKEYNQVVDLLRSIGQINNAETNLLDFCKQFTHLQEYKSDATRIAEEQAVQPLQLTRHLWLGDQVNKTGSNFETNLKLMKEKMRSNLWGFSFDTALGLGSLAVTISYGNRVLKDIYKTFAETVAYEKYANPDNITLQDIFLSDNKIVRETCNEFFEKNLWRLGTDALFFGRHLGRVPGLGGLQYLPLGELALGAKGLLLVGETQRKTTSILTDLTDMIDRKLNPQHGLGDPMRASDLLDLYQKYNLTNNPDTLFKDATSHDMHDSANWRLSNTIFARMAELMNTTYKYKHGFTTNHDQVEQLTQEILGEKRYFTMPKYLYLLGHDLIDLAQPEKTLAYVEIANRYSIQAVKDVRVLLEDKKVPLEEVLQTYAVDLQATLNSSTTPALVEISQKARAIDRAEIHNYLMEHPDVKATYNRLTAEKLERDFHSADAAHPVEKPLEQKTENHSATVIPSFFPAQSHSLPKGGNDDMIPFTTVTQHTQAARLAPELVVQKH